MHESLIRENFAHDYDETAHNKLLDGMILSSNPSDLRNISWHSYISRENDDLNKSDSLKQEI